MRVGSIAIGLLFGVLAATAVASELSPAAPPQSQQPPQPSAEVASGSSQPESAAPELQQLPEPLQAISGNLRDWESTGHLKIIESAFRPTEFLNQPALIWKLQVVRPLSCRHAELLLRRFQDVRFYRTTEIRRMELLVAQLHHSMRIADGAVHGEILKEDEIFEAWVLLSDREREMLQHDQADRVVFSERKRRRGS